MGYVWTFIGGVACGVILTAVCQIVFGWGAMVLLAVACGFGLARAVNVPLSGEGK